MPRKKKTFLKLNVNDFMGDDKLIECSPATTGVYIKMLCILIKQEIPGKLLLKQNAKQMVQQTVQQNVEFAETIANQMVTQNDAFAYQFAKYLPWDSDTIKEAIDELVREDVVQVNSNYMIQKRMYNDGQLSLKRSIAGKRGVEAKRRLHEQMATVEETVENPEKLDEVLLKQNVQQKEDFALPVVDVVVDDLLRTGAQAPVPKKDNTINSFKEGERESGEGIAKGGEKKAEFALQNIYDKTFAQLQQAKYSKLLTEQGFKKWKEFVDFVQANADFHELFNCNFVKPTDFQTLYNEPEINFKEDMWKPVIIRILGYGVKPTHNLYFQISNFIKALQKQGSPTALKKHLDVKNQNYKNQRTG